MLPRFLLTLMTRMRSSCPRSASRLRTGRTSICDPGRNARTPMSTASPPLMRSMTRPMTTLRILVGLLDLVPDLHLLGLLAREDDVAFTVLGALEQDVDDVARLRGDLAVLVDEFFDGNDAFGLEADVDDDFRRRDFHDRALDDFTFRDVAEAGIVKLQRARRILAGPILRRVVTRGECGEA